MKELDKVANSITKAIEPYQRFIPGLRAMVRRDEQLDAIEVRLIIKELGDDPLNVESHYSVTLLSLHQINYLAVNLDSFTEGMVFRFIADVAETIKEQVNER